MKNKYHAIRRAINFTLVLPGVLLIVSGGIYKLCVKQPTDGTHNTISWMVTAGFLLSGIGNLLMMVCNYKQAKQLKNLQENNLSV